MKPTVRILALLLSLLLLCACFAACNGDKNEPDADTDTQTELPDETEEPELSLSFPKENNNNTAINILMSTSLGYEIATEASSDRVEGAMFERNCDVEEYLGVVLNIIPRDGGWATRTEFNNLIQISAMSSKEFDVAQNEISASYRANAIAGYYKNVNDIPTLDLSSPWWLENMTENYGFDNTLYGILGDSSLSLYKEMNVLYFNQHLIDQYKLDNPYDLVRDKKWTLETMLNMAVGVKEDIDGDYDITQNMMGYVAAAVANRAWLTALDITLINQNAETGALTVASAPSEKLIKVFDLMYDKFENNDNLYVEDSGEYLEIFANNNALFALGFFEDVEKFRDMEYDYGLVPMCMWEGQDDYISPISTWAGMWYVLTNTEKADLVGKVLDALAFYGHRDVIPEYYEIALGLTYARDENVQEMLSIMREKAVLSFDSVYAASFSPSMYNILQMSEGFRNPPSDKTTTRHGANITTFWATNQTMWNLAAQKLYGQLS